MEQSRRPLYALLLASCSYVIVLDSFAAAVAFPRIEKAFSSTPRSTLAWLSSGYSISLAALLLVAGKLGDRYGRRRVYLWGMAVFAIAACASAAAPNPGFLISARVLQGGAGAMMLSNSIALALAEFPLERRGTAMGWSGVIGSLASLIGPVLAGNIIELGGSWRWVFLVSVPVCVLVLVVGPRLLQEGFDPDAVVERIDLYGVVLGVLWTGGLTFAVIQTGRWGWTDTRTFVVAAASLALAALFVRRCQRVPSPLLRLEIFKQRRFLVANISQIGSQLGIFTFFFSTPLFLANVWGWSAAGLGWALAVPLTISLISLPVGRFSDRHGYRKMLVVGGLIGGLSMAWWLLTVADEPRFWSHLLPGLLLFGLCIGMVGITSAAAALSGLQSEELAMGNSAFQTTRRIVQTLGTALAVAILGDRTSDSLPSFRWVWTVIGVCFVLSALAAVWFPQMRAELIAAEA